MSQLHALSCVCVWGGEVSGSTREEVESETATEMSAQTREHISILMEQ